MKLGEKIRSLRLKKNLKQSDLANALQVSPQAVSKWEKDNNAPDIFLLVKLSKLFGVSTDYLLGAHDAGQGIFEATVFSSSLRHFAHRAAQVTSGELADAANALFYQLTEIVLRSDGIPVKYTGDGFLCFFSGAFHADRAIEAAIRSKKATGNESLVITLNSGDIYLGSIGHPDYSSRDITGESVNLAFLIAPWVEKYCKSGVGATSRTVERLKKKISTGKNAQVLIPALHSKVGISEIKT